MEHVTYGSSPDVIQQSQQITVEIKHRISVNFAHLFGSRLIKLWMFIGRHPQLDVIVNAT